MEIENTLKCPSSELRNNIVTNKAYIIIIDGKEFNVYIENVGDYYITGRVAMNKVVMLVDRPGRGGTVVKLVSAQEEAQAIGPGDCLLHSEHCVVASKTLKMVIRINSVDAIEDHWRNLLTDDVFDDEKINPEKLCKTMPVFQEYLDDTSLTERPILFNKTKDSKNHLNNHCNVLKAIQTIEDSSSEG